ncbi:chaperonin [Coelomomyces lativittatus]|nr:chaperonin [Coelomomyces lativittatus]KAJ1514431.1 chaperonin [Coelomomyces lativittatus]
MYLKQNSRSITSGDEIKQVATISANGDEEVGKMIAMAMEKVGKEGVITVQEGKTLVDQLEIIEGMKLDRGFISPYFITDPKSQKVEFHQPYILLTEKKISLVQDILPALELAAQQRRPLLIIAEDIDGEAMSLCIVNKLRGQVQVCAIKAPGFGEQRQALLQDIAILCDGKVLNDENGLKFDQITVNELGKAGSITITKEDTIILHGGATDASTSSSSSSNTSSSMNTSNKEKLNERIECIRSAIQTTTSEYEKEKLQERLAKLSGGVAVIKVGGASEVEVGEKKDRFVDALNATRAAVEEGIVPGGGIALLKSSLTLNQLKFKNEDQRLGIQLIQKALQAPTKTLVDNAGGVSGAYVVGKLVDSTLNENQPFGMGYDAVHGIYTDMIQAGIVDPLKVVRTALVDAAGVASLLTTSECLVVDAPSVKSEPNASSSNVGGGAPGGMMGGGGMGF